MLKYQGDTALPARFGPVDRCPVSPKITRQQLNLLACIWRWQSRNVPCTATGDFKHITRVRLSGAWVPEPYIWAEAGGLFSMEDDLYLLEQRGFVESQARPLRNTIYHTYPHPPFVFTTRTGREVSVSFQKPSSKARPMFLELLEPIGPARQAEYSLDNSCKHVKATPAGVSLLDEYSHLIGRKRGPKPKFDARADARLLSKWKTRRFRSFKELARESQMPEAEVRRAIDRARKRAARSKK